MIILAELEHAGQRRDADAIDRLARIQRRVDLHHEGFTRRHHEAIRAGHAFRIEQAVDRDRVRALRRPFEVIRDEDRKLRSEEHTSELQSLMRISYAVFCLKKKKKKKQTDNHATQLSEHKRN